MKNLVLGALAAALMMLGLSAPPAQADPYPGTVATKTTVVSIQKRVPRTAHVVARARVTPVSGSVKVRTGYLKVICWRTGADGSRVRRDGRLARYSGGTSGVVGPRLYARGNWGCIVKYYGKKSVYKTSQSRAYRVRVI